MMTPRQRVLAAISHEEPDRTPIFERIIKSPHADALLGRRCAATNFELQMEMLESGAHHDLCLQDARDRVDLAKMLGFDMIAVNANAGPPAERPRRIAKNKWRTGNTVATLLPSGWVKRESVDQPPPKVEEELARDTEAWLDEPYRPPEDDRASYVVFQEVVRIVREEQLDLAIYSSAYGIPVCTLAPHHLAWFHTMPELMHKLYSRYSDGVIHHARRYVELGADIVGLGGDLATDHGPIISPAHYREFVMPEIRRQADAVHAASAVATNTSDGNLWPIADDFLIATGVDGYGEIDYVAGMDLGGLKRLYGDRVFFLGNLDIRFTLTCGTSDDCRRHTVECIKKGWGSGGHIMMTSNVVHEDVRLENYLACLEAYREYFGIH